MFRIRIMSVLIASCAFAVVPRLVLAQGASRDRLARAKSIRCEFPAMSSVEWDKTTGKAVAEVKSSTLSMGFDRIDADQGTARVLGPFGASEIIVRNSGGTLHLLQSFNEGPLYATTVFPEQISDGRFRAVHTRHEFTQVSLPGFTSRPEQYYGACAADQ
jgi:hypothetical protein